MENMTLSDIAAVTGNKEQDDLFGGNGFFAIIILFFIFAMFGGGFGMNGFGNAAAQGALTRAELADGFNTAEIQRNQSDLTRGQFDIQKDVLQNRFDTAQGICGLQQQVMQNRFDAQKCCCDTQKEILESRYNTQLGFQSQQAQLAQCCCDLKTAVHAEAEATRALINANTMQELRDQLQAANLQLGNLSQTNTLLAAINPTPRPAYITCSPYQAANIGYSFNGCGCQNGCGC